MLKKTIPFLCVFVLQINLVFSQKINIDSLRNIINTEIDNVKKADTYILLIQETAISNPDSALLMCDKALDFSKKINYKKAISESYGWISYLYANQAKIQESIKYLQLGIKFLETDTNKSELASAYNNLAGLFKETLEYEDALIYYRKSEKIRLQINDLEGLSNSYYNIGNLYSKLKQYDKAIEYIDKSLTIANELKFIPGIAYIKLSKGTIYYSLNNIDSCISNLNEALDLLKLIGDKRGIAHCYYNLAKANFSINKFDESKKYADLSYDMANSIGNTAILRDVSLLLKDIYLQRKDFQKAFEMINIHYKMRDSISNQENRKTAIQSKYKLEYDIKSAADSIKTLEEKKVLDAQIKQEETQRFALYGGIILVAIFAAFMYNRFRVVHKQKQIIEIKEKETQHQKHIIEEKHKEITDSINYAERIQRSFLATQELLDENLKDYFVFFKPKDVVSGDFYWADKLTNGNFVLATADSTGHGVPGAIMSLLNITSLEKAIEHNTNPSDILNHTRNTIINRLKKDGSKDGGKDGMDCTLLVFDVDKKSVKITAANNPVWIIRSEMKDIRSETENKSNISNLNSNILIEIKPDKMPVGKHDKQDIAFTQHEIALQKGDIIYTLTDGFPDQFGGDKGKKFMTKNLKEILLANIDLSMAEQKILLENTFKNWVGDLEQVDDVCVIGVRV